MTTTILITGATAGIGRATAELLAQGDVRLILTGRRTALLKEIADILPVPTHCLTLDMRAHADIAPAITSLPKEFADIDVLVNNAGLALGLTPLDQGNFEDWQTMVDTNILGLLAITRAVLPGMKIRGKGHVINIASTAGTYHYPGANVYGGTKAFVTYLSLALRADLLGTPIRVTNIEPGMVETEFSNVRFKGDQYKADAVYDGVEPLEAQNIAECIRWALAQPAHVNINRIELTCTAQAPSGLAVYRKPA